MNEAGGGCIWKATETDPYIKQFCLTDIAQMHMKISIRLFAGYGSVHITSSAYDKKLQSVLNQSGVTYDPYTRCLYIHHAFTENPADDSVISAITNMFVRAAKVVKSTEAFQDQSPVEARQVLTNYHTKYSIS